MGMDIEKRKISEIFSKDCTMIIPRYQRDFSWSERQWDDMFIDIDSKCSKGEDFFIGSVIFEKKTKTAKDCYIIDGQQRLTSLLLLLSVIRKKFLKMEEPHLAVGISKYIETTNDDGKKIIRIKNESNNDILPIIVNDYSKNEKINDLEEFLNNEKVEYKIPDTFINCFNHFSKLIDEKMEKLESENQLIWIKEFRNTLLNLYVSEIVVGSELNAYEVFEVLNARGKSLEQHELLKNYIFRYIIPNGEIDSTKKRWNSLFEKLKTENEFKKFLTHFVTYKIGKVDKNELYYNIKNYYPSKDIYNLLEDLEDSADTYLIISGKKIDKKFTKKINNDLRIINKVSKEQFKPILLALFRTYQDEKINYSIEELENTVSNIKKYICRYTIVFKHKSNRLEKSVYDFSSKIHIKDSIQARKNIQLFWEELKILLTEEKSFREAFSVLGYAKKKEESRYENSKLKCQIILEELELYYNNDFDKISIPSTIEHIKDQQQGGVSAEIGNLILLTKQDNRECVGKDFNGKKEIYAKSNFETAKKIDASLKCWDEQEIRYRTNEIAQIVESKVWKLSNKIMKK